MSHLTLELDTFWSLRMVKITLALARPTNGYESVFDQYPILHNIWDEEKTKLAKEAADEWLTATCDGQIFLIEANNTVVGITGWWEISQDDAGLRWHGIASGERNKGYSLAAIKALRDKLSYVFNFLHEAAYTEKAAAYFKKLGFTEQSDHVKKCEVLDSAGGGNFVLTISI